MLAAADSTLDRASRPDGGRQRRWAGIRRHGPVLLVLAGSLAAAVLMAFNVKAALEREAALAFRLSCVHIRTTLVETLASQIQVLQGAAGLFDASTDGVNREEWRAYTRRLQANQVLAGVQGLGVAVLVEPGNLERHIRSIRAEGFPDYAVRPPGRREVTTSIVYLEPFSGRNLRAFGYDMFSEPVRRAAMERARDTGRAALSGKVLLVQETQEDVQAGVLMYVPVYRRGLPLDTVAQRRAALQAWTYSPFRMNDFLAGAFRGQAPPPSVGFEIFDGPEPRPESLLYRSGPVRSTGAILTEPLADAGLEGRPWTLRFHQLGGPTSGVGYGRAWLALGAGILGSLLVSALALAWRLSQASAKALLDSERKFRALFENLAEGVVLHELVRDAAGQVVDYRVLDANPAFQRHTGIPLASAVGRLGSEVYGTPAAPYLEEFGQVAQSGEALAFETYFPPLDKHFRISVVSPRSDQFATLFEDITGRRRREEELSAKNEEMERFTYMVSHDLKSPLVTVRTFLGYLEQDLAQGLGERAAKDMGYIRDATARMGQLLEDLLAVSRVGRVVNPPVEVAYADLVRGALAAVAGAISARGVAVEVGGGPLTLFGDRARLEEIWQNLVENAVKYMGDQPSPRIEIGIEAGGPEPVFRVRDNGMGIDPRYQARVFGLFEKLDPGSPGTGLGLALVKRIVELHGGAISLESEGQGRGACFRFTLPLALKERTEGTSP